eukprot:CAMPEP_0175074076 /NCGR_PEP_ID=MMETSP0052_2-20121109/21046_1 /TAXON_ID=51329 ORGANISM="Polytomella parva, Strain SAG 63-3" /NCGR_SAMPLE_ID=MMETSP0052_2 /ASSEMBLY_ACC=CAM_ASM_000194 /LENGTH=81 /DNA_ID=CAMNT_0016342215 /DNA_START=51 /DNA_END=292 /DNA_ORIENTATION=-
MPILTAADLESNFHNRLERLREEMWVLCDQKMYMVEAKRFNVARDPSATAYLTQLLTQAIGWVQVELERSLRTLRFFRKVV